MKAMTEKDTRMHLVEMAAARDEWQAWQEVWPALQATGACTKEDLEASPFGDADTPGKELLEAIRVWGDKLAELRLVQAHMKR